MSELYIASMGAITSIGCDMRMTQASISAGISAYSVSEYETSEGKAISMATVPEEFFAEFEAEIDEGSRYNSMYDRMIKMAITAGAEALADLPATQKIPLILAMSDPLPDLLPITPELLVYNMAYAASLNIDPDAVRCVHNGRASGIQALELAKRCLLEQGHEFAMLGGSESYMNFSVLEKYAQQNRLLTEESLGGFVPGEAAAFTVLTTNPRHALCVNEHLIKIRVNAYQQEAGHLFSDEPYRGEGLARLFSSLLNQIDHSSVDGIFSSMNGERYWAKEYGVAFARNHTYFKESARIEHPAEYYGDVGAATGSLLLNLAASELLHGGQAASILVYASSDGPWRAGALLQAVPVSGILL
jgi:3-oxoacyl-[acyl-carrier-protein] synthase I